MIQPADKGSGICILNRVDYENEVYRQLDEKLTLPNGVEMKYYEKTTLKKLTNSHKIIQQKIQFGLDNGLIDYKIKGDIVTELPRPSKFYLLPKIHKKFTNIPKSRPIVASGGCITEKISWLCDNVAKNNVKECNSYIQDTPDLLRKLEKLNENGTINNSYKVFSLDIRSM